MPESPARQLFAAGADGRVLRRPWLLAAGYGLVLTLIMAQSAWSMVAIWLRSDTFAHGFLIPPLTAWMIWRQRSALAALPLRPLPWALPLLLLGSAGWLLARFVDVLVVEQLAYVGLLVTGVCAILGTAVARRLAFPLGFLFLAVPMGAGLEEPMMDLTAEWTVRLIRLTGIPVFQEGRFFELPTGSWSVVQACSGVRYLIASFTLGLLFAYLTYRSMIRRLVFVAASIAVPVVGNVLRAYGIVMLGHLSGMKLATGVDHLIYGWVFFGLVMLLLFWVGGFWQETESSDGAQPRVPSHARGGVAGGAMPVALLSLLFAATGPAIAAITGDSREGGPTAALTSPTATAGWSRQSVAAGDWAPRSRNATRAVAVSYAKADARVTLHLQQFLDGPGDAELVGYGDPWVAGDSGWRVAARRVAAVAGNGGHRVAEAELVEPSTGRRAIAWSFYLVDDAATESDVMAKLLQVRQRLFSGRRDGARVFLATACDAGAQSEARAQLRGFLARHRKALHDALRAGLGPAGSG